MGGAQNNLFAPRYPFSPPHRGGETQLEAAKKIAPQASPLQARILAALSLRNMTIEELSEHLQLGVSTVCGRIGELRGLGKVADSRARRKNRSGVAAIVWMRV